MKRFKPIVFLSAITFIIMIITNALANILPINGIGTGAVSDSYPNLFAPAGFTFIIWGVIYLLLAIFVLHSFNVFQRQDNQITEETTEQVLALFSLSSILNSIWIFTWHYRIIWLSMILMVLILVCLIQIRRLLVRQRMSRVEKGIFLLPFTVYFGWITVATIANATTLLVDLGWNGFGIPESWWTVIIVIIGAWIGGTTLAKFRDYGYGAVLIWAYFGILMKHIDGTLGFSGAYPEIIVTVGLSLAFFLVIMVFILRANRLRNERKNQTKQRNEKEA